MTIEPFSGFSNPISDFRNTDLPVPDGPSSTLTSPGGSVRVTSDQMFARPKDFDSPSTLTSTPVTASLPHRLVELPAPGRTGGAGADGPQHPNDVPSAGLLNSETRASHCSERTQRGSSGVA